MSIIEINNGDCLELMKDLPDKSVDLFICDLPYAETNCKWDVAIDMEKFWSEFRRLRASPRVACIHFCSTKFGYTLIKSWEKGFKMDMVWKKRNKTGGLQSRHRPMRNHEMVYFFYEQAPKYNRDTYHKRIQAKKDHNIEKECVYGNTSKMGVPMNHFEPPNPASVVEEKPKRKTIKDRKSMCEPTGIYSKENQTASSFEPPNPASVLEEEEKYTKEHLDNNRGGAGTNEQSGIFSKENIKKYNKENGSFTPPNPASVVEEKDPDVYGETKEQRKKRREKGDSSFTPPNPASVLEEKEKTTYGIDKEKAQKSGRKDFKGIGTQNAFDPPNPASVLEENLVVGDDYYKDETGKHNGTFSNKAWKGVPQKWSHPDAKPFGAHYTPPNPLSVLEEEDEPVSMFESTKVFIGKRHHQTEKPQDILEFFLKYWTDEGETVLDPTMGSGSTGVACKKLGRNFIGYEMDDKIFNVAKARIEK